MADPALVEFGHRHKDLVVLLEALAGGDGPYGDSRVIFDCVTTPAKLPQEYLSIPVTRVRVLARALAKAPPYEKAVIQEGLEAARRIVWETYALPNLLADARRSAQRIEDNVRRISRVHQIDSLEADAMILASQLGFPVRRPSYGETIMAITGFSYPLIPTEAYLNDFRASIDRKLSDLGFGGNSFAERVAAFRTSHERVPPEQYPARYGELARLFIDYIKASDASFPREANVKIVPPDAAQPGTGGSFDYGRGGEFQAETFGVPMADMTLPLLAITVGHEIGGHFRLCVMWDVYARETGDSYAEIQTMHSNMTVINEGVAEQGIIFYEDLVRTFMDPQVVALEAQLYRLNRATLGYQAARKFSDTPMSREEQLDHCIAFGLLRGSAEHRTKGFFSPRADFHLPTYSGAAYHPGMSVVWDMAGRFGKERILEAVREPISLATLEMKLQAMP